MHGWGGTHSPDVEVGLHALLLVGELEAGHPDDVEESLAHHARGRVVNLLQALLQPAARHRGHGETGTPPQIYTHAAPGTWGGSPAVAVAVADGVPAQVAVAVAGGEGVDDVLAVVMVPAAPVGVPVLPCGVQEGAGWGWGEVWGGNWEGRGWDEDGDWGWTSTAMGVRLGQGWAGLDWDQSGDEDGMSTGMGIRGGTGYGLCWSSTGAGTGPAPGDQNGSGMDWDRATGMDHGTRMGTGMEQPCNGANWWTGTSNGMGTDDPRDGDRLLLSLPSCS